VLAALSGDIQAQERPDLPAWSLAGDDGAGALWTNPANLAFDPDPSMMLLYTQDTATDARRQVSWTSNGGPLATGFAYRGGGGEDAWWTISSGLGMRLERTVTLGLGFGWQLPDGEDNNFVTWDLGLSWRPLDWIGASAAARNIGASQSTASVPASKGVNSDYAAGLVLRPREDRLLLGVEGALDQDPTDGRIALDAVTGTLRWEPMSGLRLRASGASDLSFSAGFEVQLGGSGVGMHGWVPADDPTASSAGAYASAGLARGDLSAGRDRVAQFRIRDPTPYQPVSTLFSRDTQESYLRKLTRIREAVDDPLVTGIVLHIDQTPLSLAQIEELRALMLAARENGKPVVAYLDEASSNGAYLLATAAEKVYLHPAGELDIIGLSMELQFLRSTLEMVGIEPQFARRAEYKGAVEMYTNTEASPANAEQMNALLDELSGHWATNIAAGRGISVEEVWALVDHGPFSADEAKEAGLVDGLAYPDELESDLLEELFSEDHTLIEDYGLDRDTSGWPSPREIAVIYVDGTIHSGESSTPGFFGGGYTAGSDTVVAQLRQARSEDTVKAVVLRVDSPGGSAFASDEIWRAVEQVQEKDKPVIVSMGGVAASGGYYVSAGAAAVYANPSTITGSIGVYGGKINIEGLYGKLGVGTELYDRGRMSSMWSLSRPLDDTEYAALDRLIGETYRRFKEKVEDGRDMDAGQVEEVARGRVWSGSAAQENGLVDELGTLHDAIERAQEEAGLPEGRRVDLVTYGRQSGADEALPRRVVRALIGPLVAEAAPEPSPLVSELQSFDAWLRLAEDRVWTVLPYRLEVR